VKRSLKKEISVSSDNHFKKDIMKIKRPLIYLLLLLPGAASAQDIHFSQFWMSPLIENPAMAGVDHDLSAIANYKQQWQSISAPYKTYDVSVDAKLNRKRAAAGYLSAGMNLFSDHAGEGQMGTVQGNLSIAYHAKLNRNNTLGGGLMTGLAQRSLRFEQLQWANQYDGTGYNSSLPAGESSYAGNFTYFDTGGGLLWHFEKDGGSLSGNEKMKITGGISMYHINRPRYSYYRSGERLYMKMVLHGNAVIGIKNTNCSVVPGFMCSKQGSAREIFFGSMVRYSLQEDSKYTGFVKGTAFSLGLHYRTRDAFVASMLLEMGQYAVGLSYDINSSPLKAASNGKGGFEVSIRFITPNPFLYKGVSRI
jgi:type IX secretion system PorP/SprF family membrane protein